MILATGCSNKINCKENFKIILFNETSLNFKKHKPYLCEIMSSYYKDDTIGASSSLIDFRIKYFLINEKSKEGIYVFRTSKRGDLIPRYRDDLKFYDIFIYIKGNLKYLGGNPEDELFLKSNMEYLYEILGKDKVMLYEKDLLNGYIKLE